MERVFVLGGLRSHIGMKNGVFRDLLPERLGAEVLQQLLRRFPHAALDEIICGNATGTGGNITRLMALHAGVAQQVPACTVDMQCASGLESIRLAFAKLRAGFAGCIASGGFESSSLQPERRYHPRDPRCTQDGSPYRCAQFSPEEWGDSAMLDGAERVAQREGVSRQDLDRWALRSHLRAASHRDALQNCVVPVAGSLRDEGVRDKMNEQLLKRLPPVSGERTTAGNTSRLCDGAAFVLLASETYVKQRHLSPLAELLGSCAVGGDPLLSPLCALEAADSLLNQAGLCHEQISVFEINEAFAVIDVLFERRHPLLIERYNPLGGALAYGHPYGASGAVLLLHLLASLQSGCGVCSIAAAGGLGSALLMRRCAV